MLKLTKSTTEGESEGEWREENSLYMCICIKGQIIYICIIGENK